MIIDKTNLVPREQEVLRYLGYRENTNKINDNLQCILTEQIKTGWQLAELKASWQIMDNSIFAGCNDHLQQRFSELGFTIEEIFQGKDIKNYLTGAGKIAFMAVTVGEQFEKRIRQLFDLTQYTKALVIDAVGTEMVELAADYTENMLSAMAAAKTMTTGKRFSPGYGDWPLECQKAVLQLAGGNNIGISINDSGMLIPQKSITAIMGWY